MDDVKSCDMGAAAALPIPQGVVPGAPVVVRGRLWRLERTTPYEDCTALQLRDASGRRAVLLWPFDRPAVRRSATDVRVVPPRAWLRRMAHLATRPRLGSLRATPAPSLRILPYQLAPALSMAAGHARVFLADEVGLGKTVQAGWIIADACARRHDARVLVLVPAGLRLQWQRELAAHFALDATVADARWLRQAAADLPSDINPWSLPGVYIASIDFVKRDEVLRAMAPLEWDLVVADEAHGATAPTDRHAALAAVGGNATAVVLITATPYAADAPGFASLMATGGGGQAFTFFRRSRQDVGATMPRRHRFAAIRPSSAETRLHRMLDRYTRAVWHEHGATDERARLAMIVLRKRALSSPSAVAASIARRMTFLERRAVDPVQLALFGEDDTPDDAEPIAALAVPGLADGGRERRWLTALLNAAEQAARDETKIAALTRLVGRLRHEPMIVFTEYRDTLGHLARALGPTLILHGGMSAWERDAVQRRFNEDGGLLLATDAAAEGLNLHGRCRIAINFELPWNPARLDQRIGRVDRLGQARRVHAITLVARDTAEDLVLAAFLRRLTQAARTLGERDRVCALLTETRAAHALIGGAPLDAPDPPGGLVVDAVRADDVDAAAEARRLRGQSAAGPSPSAAACQYVTSLRRCQSLPSGTIFVVDWTAEAEAGETLDVRALAIFVPGHRPCGRRAADVRDAARAAIAVCSDDVQRAIAPFAARWLDAARARYQAVAQRRAERERVLADRGGAAAPVQAGLFDRRAIHDADARAIVSRSREEAHRRRAEVLASSATRITSAWRIAGVCLVHGRQR